MDYCKTNNIPPAQKWAWLLAGIAFDKKTVKFQEIGQEKEKL